MSEHSHRWTVYEPTENDVVYKCIDCDTFRTGAQRLQVAEAEVARLQALHLERTKLTTRVIEERDAAEAKLTQIIGWREHDWPEWFCRRTAEAIANLVKEQSDE